MAHGYELRRTVATSAIGLASFAMALVSGPSLAQSTTATSNDDSTVSEVIVTGSRLKTGFDQPSPVAVIGAEQLAARAPTNVINILNELPQFRSGVSQTTGNRGTVPAGINSLDLRGLGSFETLILLDGMRLPSILSGGPADVNTIPGLLVERIETVTGGASAAYGSNAVAGVVQFILKRDYEGFEATLQGGATGEGDGGNVLGGFGWGRKVTDRLHLMVGGEYGHEDSVPGPLSRDWGRKETGLISLPATRPAGTPARVFADGVRFNTMSPGGLVTTGPLRGLNFLPNGQTGTFDFGTLTGGNLMAGSTSNEGLSPFAYGGLKIGLDRANLLARATFDINDSIESWVEGSYHQMEADQDSAQTFFRENNIIILRNNPYLPASVGAQMDANRLTQITIGRSNDEIGGALGQNENKQYRFAAGLRGSFGEGWDWDAFVSYGRSEYKQIFRNEVFVANYNAAIYAVRDASGNIVCGNVLTNPNLSAAQRAQVQAGCTPFNPFGLGSPSAAALDYVTGDEVAVNEHHLSEAAVNLRGNLFDLPAGPVAVAVGAEARKEDAAARESPFRGLFNAGNIGSFSGKVDIVEGYVEASAPLLKDVTLARSLGLNAAARYADYSSFGGNTVWKVGMTWEPVDSVRFRATRSRDVRAPSLGELYRAPLQATTNLRNPVTGVTAGVLNSTGSNPNLQPETGDTWTAGIVLTPGSGWASGLRLSVDYYDIRITDAISRLAAQTVVDFCLQNNLQDACALITFNAAAPTGFSFVTSASYNSTVNRQKGIDVEASYTTSLDRLHLPGRLSFDAMATFIKTSDSLTINQPRTNNLDVNSPRTRYTLRATYSNDRGSAFLQATGFSETRGNRLTAFGPEDAGYNPALSTSISANRWPARTYLSGGATYNLGDENHYQLFVTVDNILNTDPPSNVFFSGVTSYNLLGREYRGGIRVRW